MSFSAPSTKKRRQDTLLVSCSKVDLENEKIFGSRPKQKQRTLKSSDLIYLEFFILSLAHLHFGLNFSLSTIVMCDSEKVVKEKPLDILRPCPILQVDFDILTIWCTCTFSHGHILLVVRATMGGKVVVQIKITVSPVEELKVETLLNWRSFFSPTYSM